MELWPWTEVQQQAYLHIRGVQVAVELLADAKPKIETSLALHNKCPIDNHVDPLASEA